MSEPKYCVNCRHYLPKTECCDVALNVDLVTGKHGRFLASVERGSSVPGDCGPDAIKFVPITAKVAA